MGVLASFRAGYRLSRNITAKAESSHAAIAKTVVPVTKGSAISIIKVVMVPSEIPNPKLESNTTML
jgi:hypothetical protein